MADEKKISDIDKVYCESIGKSISNILRFSFDEEFRKHCLELLGVFSTIQAEKEISNRLVSLIEKENSGGKKRPKFKDTGDENMRVCNNFPEEDQTEEPPSTSSKCIPETSSENSSVRKSWLEISSQRFRDVVKRRKLCSSQPVFESYSKISECSTSRLLFSNSQPVFEYSNSVFVSKTSTGVLSDNRIQSHKERCEETFNFQKYFK